MKKYLLIPCLIANVISAFSAETNYNTTNFSLSAKIKYSLTQSMGGNSNGSYSESAKLQQTVQLTPSQLSQLGTDTTIRVNLPYASGINFNFSDDPNYTPGATSVSIKQSGTQGPLTASNTISASWANGSFTLKYSGKTQGKGSFNKESHNSKYSPQTKSTTLQFVKSSVTVIEAPVEYFVSSTETEAESTDLNGNETESISATLKSGQLVLY